MYDLEEKGQDDHTNISDDDDTKTMIVMIKVYATTTYQLCFCL